MENASPALAGADAAPAPGAPVVGPPVPSPDVPKNKGGRPPGTKDSKPRKSRTRKTGGAKAPQADKPAPPRDGAPDVFDAPQTGAGEPQKAAAVKIAVDPAQFAAGIMAAGNGVVGMLAGLRYPEPIAKIVPLSPDEAKELQPLLTEWLRTANVQIDPGVAFLAMFGFTLGMHVLMAEGELKKWRETHGPEGPRADADLPKGVVNTADARAAAA